MLCYCSSCLPLLSLCVALDDISTYCLTTCCMTRVLLLDCICLLMWDTNLSPYLQLSSLDRLYSFGLVLDVC